MEIQAVRVEYGEVEALRDLYRHEAHCQIIRDSMLRRGLGDPYLLLADGRTAGYGAVMNRYDPGRLTEFYILPHRRGDASALFRELLAASGATQIGAQTNLPLLLSMLYDHATNITVESILFEDGATTDLPCPDGRFRRATPDDEPAMFSHHHEPVGGWVVESEGKVVATGGFLTHYNPPYGDVFMEVAEPFRRRGFGAYLVQEVKRACYEAGRKPAARCAPDNVASRRTLEKAGLLPCGRFLVGDVVK